MRGKGGFTLSPVQLGRESEESLSPMPLGTKGRVTLSHAAEGREEEERGEREEGSSPASALRGGGWGDEDGRAAEVRGR